MRRKQDTASPDRPCFSMTGSIDMPMTVSVRGAAELTSLSEPTIWRMIRRNELVTVKLGGRRLINAESLKKAIGAA